MTGNKGFTLIELMVVVVIVGILAAIAIPAYNNYVTRSRRSDAFTALETVRAAQEMYRAENGYYIGIGDLAGCGTDMAGDNYTISVNLPSTTTYSVRAEPDEKQTGDFFLGIDHNGNQYTCEGDAGDCPAFNPAALAGNWEEKSWEELR